MKDWENIPECDVLDDYCLYRLKKGLQTNVMVTGLGGSGKSSFGTRMGQRLSAKINNGVEFTHSDILDSFLGFLERLEKIKKPGEIMVIEEVSVLFGSKQAMTQENRALGKVLDVLRKKQAIVISNAPIWKSIDSHMRAMAHVLVECKGVLRNKEVVVAKAWRLKTDPHTGVTYRFPFRRKDKKKVRLFYSKKYDEKIWNSYEREKDRFIAELIENLRKKIEIKLIKEKKDLVLADNYRLPKNQQRVVDLWKEGIFKSKEIAERMGSSAVIVSQTKKSLETKGIFPENFMKTDKKP